MELQEVTGNEPAIREAGEVSRYLPVMIQPTQANETIAKKLYRPKGHFSDLDKEVIVAECATLYKWNSVNVIAKENNVKPITLKTWVNEGGLQLASDEIKNDIVVQCTMAQVSPEKLAQLNDCHAQTIRRLVKSSGELLPEKYVEKCIKEKESDVNVLMKCPKNKCDISVENEKKLEKHMKGKAQNSVNIMIIF